MEKIMLLTIVCLVVIIAALLLKLRSIRHNLRHFTKETEKLCSPDYAQPIKVSGFDKDIVELAVKINEYADEQQRLAIGYEQEKKRLSGIVSGISHDFRTPLTSALGYMQMIWKRDELSEKSREYLDIAICKNKYLKELSDDFFELTKLENGGEQIVPEELNLSNMLSDMLIEQYGWLKERGIEPEFGLEDGVIIVGDRKYVTRIIQNLISNSEKYAMSRFGVRLKRSNETVTLSVFNDTEDIASLDTARVFEPFYKADARSQKGTGLGLYVVKNLAERLGWKVSAQSTEDGLFTVELTLS